MIALLICAALKKASQLSIVVLAVNTVVSLLSLSWFYVGSPVVLALTLTLTGVELLGILVIAVYIVAYFMG